MIYRRIKQTVQGDPDFDLESDKNYSWNLSLFRYRSLNVNILTETEC